MNENNILIDWLTVSFKISNMNEIVEILKQDKENFIPFTDKKVSIKGYEELCSMLHIPVEKMIVIKSFYGYNKCLYYEGIKIHIADDSVILDLSGKGCRMVETLNREHGFNWFEFLYQFDYMIQNKICHIARMDVACDIQDKKVLDLDKLINHVIAKKYICKSKRVLTGIGNYERWLMFGSPKSDRRLRIYDKALEQKLENVYWVRLEMQLRNECALSFYLNWIVQEGSIGLCYSKIMCDYLRFTTKPNNCNDGHQSRLITCTWWTKFLGVARGIGQLYLPGIEYSISTLTNYLQKNCSSSIKTYLACNNGDLSELLEMVDNAELSHKQKTLIEMLSECEMDDIC